MPGEAMLRTIEEHVAFARKHALEKYRADLKDVAHRVLDGGRVWTLKGDQNGLFVDKGIGSRSVKSKYGVEVERMVLIGDMGDTESNSNYYFGVIYHEFGHATFDVLGKNSEHGAFCMELTALVDAVVAGLVPLGTAQAYTRARIALGMLSEDIRLVKNAEWQMRYRVSRQYLTNDTRTVISYPGGNM